jgi:hypothetical protein
VPAKNRFRRKDAAYLDQCFPSQNLALNGQPPSLSIREKYSLLADFLPQNSVFGNQIFNGMLLLLIDPARQNEKKHLPGRQNRFPADSALFLGRDSIGYLGFKVKSYERMSFSAICKLFIRCHLRTAEYFDPTALSYPKTYNQPGTNLSISRSRNLQLAEDKVYNQPK